MTEFDHDATSAMLQTPSGALHYHEVGEGPPLLLLHGSGPGVSGWANYRNNLHAFAPHFRTLVLDMPGFGKSYSCDGSPLAAAPQAVVDFLDGMNLASVPIVGNSMGGGVAARIAANNPDRVSRLVTIGGVGFSIFGPSPTEGIKLLVAFVEDPTRARLIAWMESMVFDPAILTEEFVELRWQSANAPGALNDVAKMFNSGVLAAMRSGRGVAADQVGILSKIKAPTLLTYGRDDRVTPLDTALVPMRLIRNCEVHIFPNCGHWVMIERQAEWESTVLSFLLRDRTATPPAADAAGEAVTAR